MAKATHFDGKAALRAGAIAGVTALLICLVGMVAAFGKRNLIGGAVRLSVGHTLFFLNMVLAGYLALRRAQHREPVLQVLGGAMAGLIASAMVAVLVVIDLPEKVNLRAVLINASPDLYALLTFGQAPLVGLGILVLSGTFVAALTTGTLILPPRFRRAISLGVTVLLLVGLLQDLLKVMFTGWGALGNLFLWMFEPAGGLSLVAALTVLIVAGGLNLFFSYYAAGTRQQLRAWIASQSPQGRLGIRAGSIAFLGLVLLSVPFVVGRYPSEVLNTVGLFALMGLGLNIVVGFAGLLDLGYVAFFAIGAYTMGVLTSPEISPLAHPLTFWEALPFSLLAALLSGVILGIPVLNTRGDYLAIVTLGFGEIVRLLFLSDWLRPYVGGAQGIQLIAPAKIGDLLLTQPRELYYLILVSCLIVVFVSSRLKNSRLGRAWMAVREDEDVAQAMGIELVSTKLLAFATGATFAGLSGAIFATKLGSIYPHSFQLLYSIYVLCLLIVGGMGNVPGVLVGSLLLIGLPELLREFSEYRMLVYGVALVFMMLTRPEGFLPDRRVRREVRAEVEENSA
ncbi:MAG: branched-chain amino acid ABC transporter permease [Chloroflexia bacterium]